MQTVDYVKNAGGVANLAAVPRQLAPDVAGIVNSVRPSLSVPDRLIWFQRPEHWLEVIRLPCAQLLTRNPCSQIL